MSKNDLHIDILGTKITISAEEPPEYLDRLLEKFRLKIENVQQKAKLADPLKTAVLTGFLLCDELEKAGAARAENPQNPPEDPREAEQLTLAMISRLDELMPPEDAEPHPAANAGDSAEESRSGDSAPKPRAFVYKLTNTVKHYNWGSADLLPAFLGLENPGRVPWAELWMGVNPSGASRADPAGERPRRAAPDRAESLCEGGTLLSELIAGEKDFFLGEQTARKYGTLPFLFKVLAVAKPLSLQAHPRADKARDGFERENRAGIPLNAPHRNYRDESHKPEIICALSPFVSLCGFRPPKEISLLVEILSIYAQAGGDKAPERILDKLFSALERRENPLEAFIHELYRVRREDLNTLGLLIKSQHSPLANDFPEYRGEWDLCVHLADLHPGDPGILAPLYLNIVELSPGEAAYIPAGVLHAHLNGMGIELMSDSDNVLRGGLTSKYVDQEELLGILDFSEYKPEIMKVPSPRPAWYTYPSPAGDFSLSVLYGRDGETSPGADDEARQNSGLLAPARDGERGPSIMIITEGNAVLSFEGEAGETDRGGSAAAAGKGLPAETVLLKGESVFLPAGRNPARDFSGNFTAYIASVPCKSS